MDFIRKGPSNKVGLLLLFRYISLVATSLFYLTSMHSPLFFKMGVVFSLSFAAWMTTDLQKKYLNNDAILKSLVLTETIGLTLLLIVTGGITSPFIWYALNPVLVAASFLTASFCWSALTFFLGSATLIAHFMYKIDNLLVLLSDKSYFYLVCFLITILVRLFSELTKELDAKASQLKVQQEKLQLANDNLSETNAKYLQTLEHVMSLYRLMENFDAKKSPKNLAKEITNSLMNCTESDEAFFWLTDLDDKNSYLTNTTANKSLESDLKKDWLSFRRIRGTFTRKIRNELYCMKIIRASDLIGVVGIKISSSSGAKQTFLLNRSFEFIAELSEMMLERMHLDQMMDQMIVIEEQNRIANEIHDSVSQRLFGIVLALHSLQMKSQHMSAEQLQEEYRFLSQSANKTIKELRAAIFRLSSMKKGEKPFLVRLKKYLDEFSKLNDVKIDYEIAGDEALISDKLKQGLYRIVCEACGNAVRHGECNVITLRLSIVGNKTALTVSDDGVGIHTRYDESKKEKGIGLLNMQSIVKSFAGTFTIDSVRNAGTAVRIEIPNSVQLEEEEVLGL